MRAFDAKVIERYTAAGHWDDLTTAQCIRDRARTDPDGPAFVTEDERLSWLSYDEHSTRLAAVLVEAGLETGDRLAVLLPDGPAVHVAYVAAEKAGLVSVGIGPRSRANEVRHILATAECRAILTARDHRGKPTTELVAEVRALGHEVGLHLVLETDGDDTIAVSCDGVPLATPPTPAATDRALGANDLWLVNSTSGTTGLPKCVMQTQNRWKYFHQVAGDAGRLSSEDVFMSLIPAPFGFGLWTAHFTPTLLGSPTVVQREFDADGALALIEREGVTVLCCVSTQFILMLNSPALERYDLGSLRVMFTGGERVPYSRSLEFEGRTGCTVLQFYGSNESGAVSRTTIADPPERRLGTAGRVIEAMNARVVDVETGEDLRGTGRGGLCLCGGPAATPGYYNDPDANARLFTPTGEMRTSDLVTIDDDGYLTVVGRDSDIVIRGGMNISASVVEEMVGAHPRVAMVGVVGAPDDVFGERVCAFVTTRDGESIGREELAAFLDGRGASKHLWPEQVIVIDQLPRATGGKVDKAELRKRAREERALDTSCSRV